MGKTKPKWDDHDRSVDVRTPLALGALLEAAGVVPLDSRGLAMDVGTIVRGARLHYGRYALKGTRRVRVDTGEHFHGWKLIDAVDFRRLRGAPALSERERCKARFARILEAAGMGRDHPARTDIVHVGCADATVRVSFDGEGVEMSVQDVREPLPSRMVPWGPDQRFVDRWDSVAPAEAIEAAGGREAFDMAMKGFSALEAPLCRSCVAMELHMSVRPDDMDVFLDAGGAEIAPKGPADHDALIVLEAILTEFDHHMVEPSSCVAMITTGTGSKTLDVAGTLRRAQRIAELRTWLCAQGVGPEVLEALDATTPPAEAA